MNVEQINIPDNWKLTQIKRVASNITDGAHTSPDKTSNDFPFLSVINLKNGSLDFKNCLHTSEEDYHKLVRNGCNPKKNDVLFSKDGTIGETVVITDNKEFVVGSSFIIITPNLKELNPFFLHYMLNSDIIKYQTRTSIKGIGLPRISIFNLSKLFFFYPSLKEQQQIAKYLDQQTKTIDKKINLLETKIEHYQALKKSLINETVCRGLDKTVALKDSGIEWIGAIPEHWEVKRFKSFASTIKGKKLKSLDKPKKDYYPLLSLDYLRNDLIEHIEYCTSNNKKLFATNKDYIIIWDGAGVGEILKAKEGFISLRCTPFIGPV
ncbi:restriction endonuclease subunit S [Aureispira sp. CCB-QB1]|uniref:restriction endonuclease subunit S n=1 Tax=Aureispira sp. CCB-QB1 TaxID=1313421 RepID=UPI0006973999|nr:restriction endonuclease subunit S [Aureispira sp. CCB-QB1]